MKIISFGVTIPLRYHSLLRSLVSVNVLRRRGAHVGDSKQDTVVVPVKEARRFIVECLVAAGTPKSQAETMASVLVEADYKGHHGHGLNRLDKYVADVKGKLCNAAASPKILKEGPVTAWVDGQNGFGGVVAKFCMDLAIKKAKKEGIGWVCTKGSNHYSIGCMYSSQAVKEGVIGICFSNTSPLMSPTRSKKAALGTNPLTVGAPAEDGDCFNLDMATTAVAVGKIEVFKRKKEPIPEGWAQDTEGRSTTDPEVAYKSGCMMPLGGLEINSGYKGYGLALLVEVFCGMLSDSEYGPHIRLWGKEARVGNLGQCFVAVNPKCFAPGFECRLSDLLGYIRNMEPVDPKYPVLVPGDPEKLHMQATDKIGGIRYLKDLVKTCQKLAADLKVAPLKPVS